jgi:hypothetical protein
MNGFVSIAGNLCLIFICAAYCCLTGCSKKNGRVVDAETFAPIPGVEISHNGKSAKSDKDGRFVIGGYDEGRPVFAKSAGYRSLCVTSAATRLELNLRPIQVKGIFLSHAAACNESVRTEILGHLGRNGINTLVVDVKGDNGLCTFEHGALHAGRAGALGEIAFADMKSFIRELHEREIYVIGRIVVFRDNLLAKYKPEWAVRDARTGGVWRGAWADPFSEEVWDYNISIAREAACIGFDEILFDALYFPTSDRDSSAKYVKPVSIENRRRAVQGFLAKATEALAPFHVYTSASTIEGPPQFQANDERSLTVKAAIKHLDYVCPELNPPAPNLGLMMKEVEGARAELGDASVRHNRITLKIRPWVRLLNDRATSGARMTSQDLKAVISGLEATNMSGWMLWDIQGNYTNILTALNELQHERTGK